jgi:hypothetical protein
MIAPFVLTWWVIPTTRIYSACNACIADIISQTSAEVEQKTFPSRIEKCEFFTGKAHHRAKNMDGESSDTTCGVAYVTAVIPYSLTFQVAVLL